MKCDPAIMPHDDIALEFDKLKVGDIVAFYCKIGADRLKWERQDADVTEYEVSRHIIRGFKEKKVMTTLLYTNPRDWTHRWNPGDNYLLTRSNFSSSTWEKL